MPHKLFNNKQKHLIMVKVMLMLAEAREAGADERVIKFLEDVLDNLIYERLETA